MNELLHYTLCSVIDGSALKRKFSGGGKVN